MQPSPGFEHRSKEHKLRCTDLLSTVEEVVTDALNVFVPVVHCDWITQSCLCLCSHKPYSTEAPPDAQHPREADHLVKAEAQLPQLQLVALARLRVGYNVLPKAEV